MTALPTGKRGQVLAFAILLAGLAIIWLAVVSPLVALYQERAIALAGQQALAARMAALVANDPNAEAATGGGEGR